VYDKTATREKTSLVAVAAIHALLERLFFEMLFENEILATSPLFQEAVEVALG
jgi:hypothetical protein